MLKGVIIVLGNIIVVQEDYNRAVFYGTGARDIIIVLCNITILPMLKNIIRMLMLKKIIKILILKGVVIVLVNIIVVQGDYIIDMGFFMVVMLRT